MWPHGYLGAEMNDVNWGKLAAVMGEKCDRLAAPAQFRLFAALLLDTPYVWGEENPEGTDCSGTLAFPLLMMGYNVRLTADGFLRQVYREPAANLSDLGQIAAVFYVARTRRKHGARVVEAGTAVHVTPVMGQGVVLNAQGGRLARLQPASVVESQYAERGCDAIRRRLDMSALMELHRGGRSAWGVDPIVDLMRVA